MPREFIGLDGKPMLLPDGGSSALPAYKAEKIILPTVRPAAAYLTVPGLEGFGSKAHPLRCSALPELVRCTWRAAQLFLDMCKDNSGEAADTGSMVHAGVGAWHKYDQDYKKALRLLNASRGQYALGDVQKAQRHFHAYTQDPRNQTAEIFRDGKTLWVEQELTFALPAHPLDQTGQPIHVTGHLDQVRVEDGTLRVWDVKTGGKNGSKGDIEYGRSMCYSYLTQLIGYCFGAMQRLGRPVFPGGLIRTEGYFAKTAGGRADPDGIFWPVNFKPRDFELILDAVRLRVAEVRAGLPRPTSGDHCFYCPANGPELCVQKLKIAQG